MKLVSSVKTIVITGLLLQLIGCSSTRTLPAPAQSEPIAINFTEKTLSGWSDLPMGVHRIPDSQVIISGHQSHAMIGILFGPLGLAVQSSIDSGRGENASEEGKNILQITLTEEAKTISQELALLPEFNKSFTTTASPHSPTLDVSTALIMTFKTDTTVKPYVLLQANLKDTNQKSVWRSRYIASSGDAKPFSGDQGWAGNNATVLKNYISQNLKKAIEVMLTDIASPYTRNEKELFTVQGYFPYVRPKLQTTGFDLHEDEDFITYLPRVGDAMTFSGVNIMDRQTTTIKPYEEGTPFLKVIKDDAIIKNEDKEE